MSTLGMNGGELFGEKKDKDGNAIVFSAYGERAEVVIEDGQIVKVLHYDNNSDVPTVITADEAHQLTVGEGNWRRNVHHFLKPGGPSPTMRLGITVHDGLGTWSSLPHGFEHNLEPGFEEVFYYLLEGGSQTAIQRGQGIWADGEKVDEAWLVHDREFSKVPMGYHPVGAEPNVRASYVWCYLAKKPQWEKI